MQNIHIEFNGSPQMIHTSSLYEWLKSQNVQLDYVAIALNNNVIPTSSLSQIQLKDGDAIEVVHAVCGG